MSSDQIKWASAQLIGGVRRDVKFIASPFAWLHIIDKVANLPFDASSYKTNNVFIWPLMLSDQANTSESDLSTY